MKKVFALIFLVSMYVAATAQQIPNGSFQYWATSQAPNAWGTWSSAIGSHNQALADTAIRLAQRDTTAGYYPQDSASLLLRVDTIQLPGYGRVTLSGFAALGGASYQQPPSGLGLQLGYLRYAARPDTLYFDYKMIPAPGAHDTAIVAVGFSHWDTTSRTREILISRAFALAADSQWQYNVAIPLTDYYEPFLPDTLLPDSIQIIFYASKAAHPTIGTSLWVDSVRFDASVDPLPTGLPAPATIRNVAIWPNPATDRIYVGLEQKEVGDALEMYDASGRLIYRAALPELINAIPVGGFAPGAYALRIRSRDGITTYRSQISVVR